MHLAFIFLPAAVLPVISLPAGPAYLRCGHKFDDTICPNNLCCSIQGYCGTGPDYCAVPGACHPDYGYCDSKAVVSGPSTAYNPRPRLGRVSYSEDILHCTQPNVVALTYDDGPSTNTGKILDLLASRNVTATFFIAGNNNGKGPLDDPQTDHPAVLRRMMEEGHQIASHSFSHFRLTTLTPDVRKTDMYNNERAIANVIGQYPTYMRPPYGDCIEDCAQDMEILGYHRIQEDLDTRDWIYPKPDEIDKVKAVVDTFFHQQQRPNVLSLQHDHLESVFELTSYILDHAEARGWKSVTVGECLGDERANWYRPAAV